MILLISLLLNGIVGVFIHRTIGFKGLFLNIKKNGFKYFTASRAEVLLDWDSIQANGLTLKADDIDNYVEQYMYRKIICEDCWEEGKCKSDCGCITKAVVSTPSAECGEGNWVEMMSKEEWEEHKKTVKIKFGLK